jgi:hypothetical protein
VARLSWVLLVMVAQPATAQRLAYEGALGMSTGRYIFTGRTTTFSLSTGLGLTAGRLTVRASLPVWLQNSTVIATAAGGTLPSGGSSGGAVGDSGGGRRGGGGSGGGPLGQHFSAARRVETPASAFTDYRAAVGDPTIGLSVRLLQGGRIGLTVGGVAKIPLADTAHYGTGEWDAGASASASLRVAGTTFLGFDVGWWYLGDLPQLDFDNPVSGSFTLSHLVSSRWVLSAFGRASSASVAGFSPPASIGGGITWLGASGALGLEVSAGLSETSPDVAATAYWRIPVR